MNAPVPPQYLDARPTRLVVLSLAAVYLIWGSTYLAMRIAVAGLPPFFMAGSRFLVTGAVMLVFLRLRGAPWPTRREWLMALPVGTLMFVFGNGTVAFAEQHLSSGIAAVVCGTMPLWTAALGPLFKERTSPREWLALVLGFAGVLVLSLGGELRAEPFSAAILVIAPISWAAGSLLARRLPMARGLMSAATQMLVAGALMAVVSPLLGERLPAQVSVSAIAAWAYLCVFGSLVAYSAYTYLLRATRPAIATSYAYVNPAIAVAIGAVLGGEHLRAETVVAVTLIIAATVLLLLQRNRQRAPAVSSVLPAPAHRASSAGSLEP